MIRLVLATLLLALVGGMHPLHAQSVDWRAVTRQDLAAARNLLREVHPAAQLRVGDTAFRAALDSGFATAMALADRISDAGGYRAVLRRFANGFDDGHISVSFTSMPTGVFRWAGIMVRRVAGEFVVAHVDSRVTNVRVGDRVVSCDGTSIDALARLRLGRYRAVWSVEADIVRTAFYLLLDDGNPFEPVASQCTVVTSDTVSRVVSLTWTPIDAPTLNSLVPHSAGFMGVRSMDAIVRDDVYWISMSHMGSDADAMLQSVARTRQRLNGIGAIVIDLRGNGGGSSRKGEELMTSRSVRQGRRIGEPRRLWCSRSVSLPLIAARPTVRNRQRRESGTNRPSACSGRSTPASSFGRLSRSVSRTECSASPHGKPLQASREER
jgi:hypothetical protein